MGQTLEICSQIAMKVGSSLPLRSAASFVNSPERRYPMLTWEWDRMSTTRNYSRNQRNPDPKRSSCLYTFAFSDSRTWTWHLIQQTFTCGPGTPALSLCSARISQNLWCIWSFFRPRLANCSVYVTTVAGPSSWYRLPTTWHRCSHQVPVQWFNCKGFRKMLSMPVRTWCQLQGFGSIYRHVQHLRVNIPQLQKGSRYHATPQLKNQLKRRGLAGLKVEAFKWISANGDNLFLSVPVQESHNSS